MGFKKGHLHFGDVHERINARRANDQGGVCRRRSGDGRGDIALGGFPCGDAGSARDEQHRRPLLRTFPKGCPKHHGHKEDLGVTPGTCDADGEKAQMVLV